MAEQKYQTLDLIEQIFRNDNTSYYEIANITLNGRAETAAIKGLIKEVRILQLNIPRSKAVVAYENYINENYSFPDAELTGVTSWEEWKKDGNIEKMFKSILRENHIG